jgi:hypothetical protein
MVTDLGEQPPPQIEPAEPPPGGVDAVEESLYEEQPLVPDLSHIGNERAKDEIPDAVTEPDETDTAATRRVDGPADSAEEQAGDQEDPA